MHWWYYICREYGLIRAVRYASVGFSQSMQKQVARALIGLIGIMSAKLTEF